MTSEGRDEQKFNCIKGEGLVANIFTDDKLAKLTGKIINKVTVRCYSPIIMNDLIVTRAVYLYCRLLCILM